MRDLNRRVNPRHIIVSGKPMIKWRSHVTPQANPTPAELSLNRRRMVAIGSEMLPEATRYPNLLKCLEAINKLFRDNRLGGTIELLKAGAYPTPKSLAGKLETFL